MSNETSSSNPAAPVAEDRLFIPSPGNENMKKIPPIVVWTLLDENGMWAKDPPNHMDPPLAEEGFKPWQDESEPDMDPAAREVDGSQYEMVTSQGEGVWVWIPSNKVANNDWRYFCHGFSLGTYDFETRKGYSVNMNSMPAVLNDWQIFQRVIPESHSVITDLGTETLLEGDILAWWERDKKDHNDINCKHSALIIRPEAEGNVLQNNTQMATKNGIHPKQICSLGELRGKYGNNAIEGLYRRWEEEPSKPPNWKKTGEFRAGLLQLLIAAYPEAQIQPVDDAQPAAQDEHIDRESDPKPKRTKTEPKDSDK